MTEPRWLIVAILAFAPVPMAAQDSVEPTARRLTLGDAARLSAARATRAVTAKERAVQSGARAYQARAELLPTITSDAVVDGGSNEPATFSAIPVFPQSERTVDMRVKVTQKLFDLPSLRRWQSSSADAHAAGAQAYQAADAAARDGALAYLNVLRSDAQLAARVADSVLAAELLEIARKQLQAGTAIALDVTRSESQLASAISQLITVRSERARTELELIRELALPIDTRITLGDSLRLPAATDVEVTEAEAIRMGLTRRGDVLAADAQADAARKQVSAARAERLPVVALFGSAGSNSEGAYGTKSYGIQVTVPMFDGFRREAKVEEGRAREREAEASSRDARLRTEVEVRSALLDLAAARERVTAAGVQLRLAEQEVAQARERFRAGVAGNADVITASLTLNEARDVVVDALSAYHLARISLASAQGMTTSLR